MIITSRRALLGAVEDHVLSYVPNCSGSYNPTAEVDKAYAAGVNPSASLLAKAELWVQTCGSGSAIAPAVAAPTSRAGVTATAPMLRALQPQGTPVSMPNVGGLMRQPAAGPTTQPPPQADATLPDLIDGQMPCPQGYYQHTPCDGGEPTCIPNHVQTAACMPPKPATASWLSENKGTVAIGLVALVGAIILVKAL